MRPDVALGGAPVDRFTQRWVIATGRAVGLEGSERWLDGPIGAPDGVGEDWIEQYASRRGATLEDGDGQGLLPEFAAALSGAGVDVDGVSPAIVDFYENTSDWSMDVWSRWSRWAEPGGRLINAVFARRLRQLSLPMDPLDVASGMRSRVVGLVGPDGRHLGTAWQRTVRSTGATIFGGFYGIVTRPSASRPSIRVVFPLPNGSLTVFLRPDAAADGGLVLSSPAGEFGDDGAYLIVRPDAGPSGWARRIPLPERFELFTDVDGVVRCDHRLGQVGDPATALSTGRPLASDDAVQLPPPRDDPGPRVATPRAAPISAEAAGAPPRGVHDTDGAGCTCHRDEYSCDTWRGWSPGIRRITSTPTLPTTRAAVCGPRAGTYASSSCDAGGTSPRSTACPFAGRRTVRASQSWP